MKDNEREIRNTLYFKGKHKLHVLSHRYVQGLQRKSIRIHSYFASFQLTNGVNFSSGTSGSGHKVYAAFASVHRN